MMRRGLLIAGFMVIGVAAGAQPGQRAGQSCVDVKIGDDQYYNCLNQRLQSGVEQHRFTSRDAPLSAASPSPAVGSFNQAATRERLGSSFGHSVVPQRPPPGNFASPVVGNRR